MVRRHLIAWIVSGTSVLGTAGLTVVTVATPAQAPQASPAAGPPVTVYDDRYINDYVVTSPAPVKDTTTTSPHATEASRSPTTVALAPPAGMAVNWPAAAAGTAVASAPAQQPTRTPDTTPPRPSAPPGLPNTTPPTTVPLTSPPRSTTTVPSTVPTATTLPPGAEVPRDWPAGVPYPPILAGCSKPHLEDNGQWNCEH